MGINNFQRPFQRNHGRKLRLTASRSRALIVAEPKSSFADHKILKHIRMMGQHITESHEQLKSIGLLIGVSAVAIAAVITISAIMVLPGRGDAQIVPQKASPSSPQPEAQTPVQQSIQRPVTPPTNPAADNPAGSLEELFGITTTPDVPATATDSPTGEGLDAQDALLELLGKPAPNDAPAMPAPPVETSIDTPVEPVSAPVTTAPMQQPVLPLPTMPAASDMPAVPSTPQVPVLKSNNPVSQAPAIPKVKPARKTVEPKKAAPKPASAPVRASTAPRGLPSELLQSLEPPVQQQPVSTQVPVQIPAPATPVDPGMLPSNIVTPPYGNPQDNPQDNPLGSEVQPQIFQVDPETMGDDAALTPLDQLLEQQRSMLGGATLETRTVQQPPAVDIADSPAITNETTIKPAVEDGFIDTLPATEPGGPIPQIAPDYRVDTPQIASPELILEPIPEPIPEPVINPADEAALKAAIAAELSPVSAEQQVTPTPLTVPQPQPKPSTVEQRAAAPYEPKPDVLQAPTQNKPVRIAPRQQNLAANLPVNTRLERLLFRQHHSNIPKQYTDNLERLATVLRQNPGSVIQLQGYAGYVKNGSLSATEHLSRKRAMLVAQQLQSLGVRPQQLQIAGMGVDFRGAVPKDRVDIVVIR